MEVLVTTSLSFYVDLDDVKCYNIETGEMTNDLSQDVKLKVLNGVSDTWTIASFNDVITHGEILDYEIFDVELED